MISIQSLAMIRAAATATLMAAVAFAIAGALLAFVGDEARGASSQGATLLRAELSGNAEVPPVTTEASGEAVLALESDGTTLHFVVTVQHLESPTAAHLHVGVEGVNGPPIIFLYDETGTNAPGGLFDADHPISGTVTIDSTQAATLLAGGIYVNVHTNANPGGEIRGQVGEYDASERTFTIGLSGLQEEPPVATTMTGIATFTLGAGSDAMMMSYQVSVSDAGMINAAHIHRGERGTNGPPFQFLYDRTGSNGPGGEFDDDNPISGTFVLTTTDFMDVLAGSTYVNIHTTLHPGGEIRGQLVTSGSALPGEELGIYRAALRGVNEVPPVTTSASGEAFFAFDSDGVSLHYVVNVAAISNITAAHLHHGASGTNGPPIKFLYDATGIMGPGGEFGPDDPIRGTVTLSTQQADLLHSGDLYLNVHTTTHPGGEIRGQLMPFAASALVTQLSGYEEVPPVVTSATGELRTRPTGNPGELWYRLAVTDITDISAAHLHRGRRGTNGPPVKLLYDRTAIGGPGDLLAPNNPITGVLSMDAQLLVDLYGGFLYVNVHTNDHPAGEIRGQLADEPAQSGTPTPTSTATSSTATPTATEDAGTPTATMTPDGLATPTLTMTPDDLNTPTATMDATAMASATPTSTDGASTNTPMATSTMGIAETPEATPTQDLTQQGKIYLPLAYLQR